LGDAEDGDLAQSRRQGDASGSQKERAHTYPGAQKARVMGDGLEDVEDTHLATTRTGQALVEFAELVVFRFVDEANDRHQALSLSMIR
jgi:hypothetical protein